METTLHTHQPHHWEQWTSKMLSVLRIVAGILFIQHGTGKLFNMPDVGSTGVELTSLLGMAGIIEIVGGALLIIGFLTRPVAIILALEMIVAYILVHLPQGAMPIQNNGELSLVYCFLFLFFAVAGPGKWSVDYLLKKNHNNGTTSGSTHVGTPAV